jgi:diamine N-acetyltransferase
MAAGQLVMMTSKVSVYLLSPGLPGLRARQVFPRLLKLDIDMKLEISRAQPSDLRELRAMSIKTFRDSFAAVNTQENMDLYMDAAFKEARIREELSTSSAHFYFCKFDAKPIGYMKLNFSPSQTDINDPFSLEIERIYILKEFQNLKAGEFLINSAIDIARSRQLKYIWLGVWEHNVRAINFYNKHGFKQASTHSFMLGTDHQVDIIMKRTL